MLAPRSIGADSFVDLRRSSQAYALSDVRLEIPNSTTAIFKAKLNGPEGAPVWARAWLSNELGTLAEAASPQLRVGDEVTLEVTLEKPDSPENACMRIESSPLNTEHVVVLKLS